MKDAACRGWPISWLNGLHLAMPDCLRQRKLWAASVRLYRRRSCNVGKGRAWCTSQMHRQCGSMRTGKAEKGRLEEFACLARMTDTWGEAISLESVLAELLLSAEEQQRPPAFALGSRSEDNPRRQKRLVSKLQVSPSYLCTAP